ncbi:MAG: O-antigen ligase family protein [Microscillaceae bacterium]|nr:O-antigen ligase family protein [Microscillaceae bacterium]
MSFISKASLWSSQLCFILLLLVFISLPASIRINSLIVVAFSVSFLIYAIINRPNPSVREWDLYIIFTLFYLNQVIGYFFTDFDYQDAGHQLEVKITLLLNPIFFIFFPTLTKRQLHTIFVVFIFSCLGFSLYATVLIFLSLLEQGSISINEIKELLPIHRPFMGLYDLFALVLCVHLVKEYNKFKRILFGVLAIYFVFFIIFIVAKAAILILVLFVILLVFRQTFNKFYYIVLYLMPVFFFSTMIFLYSYMQSTNQIIDENFTPANFDPTERHTIFEINQVAEIGWKVRLSLWECGIEVWTKNVTSFWLGHGTGDDMTLLKECYKSKEQMLFYVAKFHSHNEYIQEAIKHGMVGLLLLLAAILYPYYLSIKLKKELYIYFLLLIMISMGSDVLLSSQKTTVLYSFFNALFAFQVLKKKDFLIKNS